MYIQRAGVIVYLYTKNHNVRTNFMNNEAQYDVAIATKGSVRPTIAHALQSVEHANLHARISGAVLAKNRTT